MHESILTGMRDLKTAYASAMEPVARQYGMTPIEMEILLFLHNNPAQDTAQDICDLRGLAKSNISKAVERLGEMGYLTRACDSIDRRVVRLKLITAALPLVEAAQAARRAFFQTLLYGVTDEEYAMLRSILQKIHGNLMH
ncbi:MAG: MarR family transcriptional regulator [Clostridia bacterium]